MGFLASLLGIVVINLVLSGDNAVVIAMATVRLPEQHRKRAVLLGSLLAVGLRIVLTVAVAWLLRVPMLQAIGGLALVYIAHNLLSQHGDDTGIKANTSLWGAIRTIIAADFVMSLDNILAVGGASQGNMTLLVLGLMISMVLIMWGSTLISKLMERLPGFVYVGAGILIWTAGKMMVDDRYILSHFPIAHRLELAFPFTLLVAVLGYTVARQALRSSERSNAA